VRSIPVTDLVKKLENGKRITEKSVVDDSKFSVGYSNNLCLQDFQCSTRHVMLIL